MKVKLNNGCRGYSGKLGNVVYCSYHNYQLCLGRKYVFPKLGAQHQTMKEINLNLNAMYLAANPDYREDWKKYALRNSMENTSRSIGVHKRMPSAKALFVQCMWKWAKANPGLVELQNVSLEDLVRLESSLCRVCDCVEAGYLKKVTGWEYLSHSM
jgi:hypothetical protein